MAGAVQGPMVNKVLRRPEKQPNAKVAFSIQKANSVVLYHESVFGLVYFDAQAWQVLITRVPSVLFF